MMSIDPVMAEYITIMVINNKTAGASAVLSKKMEALTLPLSPAQITTELEDCAFSFSSPPSCTDKQL